jgi:hypothetical protein
MQLRHQTNDRLVVLSTAILVMLATTSQVSAQSPASKKLAMLRTQNAYQQQQGALQLAIQQTNLLTQRATRQDTSSLPAGFFAPLDFGPQQAALQFAFQESTMTPQLSSAARGAQSTVYVSSTIQSVIQTSAILQNMTQLQGGQLTADQIQSLFNEQAALTNLLAIPRR